MTPKEISKDLIVAGIFGISSGYLIGYILLAIFNIRPIEFHENFIIFGSAINTIMIWPIFKDLVSGKIRDISILKKMIKLSEETAHLSNMRQVKENPLYAEIEAYGKPALGILFRAIYLKDIGVWTWMSLIVSILDEGPEIPVEDYGKLDKIRDIYVEWGKKKGYIQ